MAESGADRVVGILLAAGQGRRFDPTGVRNKLLQTTASGLAVIEAAASTLLAVTGTALAVIPPHAEELSRLLRATGCRPVTCPQSDQGMGASLVCGLRAAPPADGYLIALGDMPYVQADTLRALVDAIAGGAGIAAPVCDGRRGNPVAFSSLYLPALLRLQGDEGARRLLKNHPVQAVAVADAGIFRDVDTPGDL